MHRVVDVTPDASHATPRCTAANHVIRRYTSAFTSDGSRTTWLDLGRERHEISRPTLDIHRLQGIRAPESALSAPGTLANVASVNRDSKPVGPTFGPTR